MNTYIIDFEARSRVSLKDTNAYKYARHSSTEVLCMSYGLTPWDVDLWRRGDPFPFDDFENTLFKSANAEFELEIWNNVCVSKYGWPELDPEKISCVQAQASYAGLPRKLDMVGRAIGFSKLNKDAEGHKIMLRLAKPVRGKLVGCTYIGGEFDEDPEKHLRNERYCIRDTELECSVDRLTPDLPKFERRLWLVHQRINKRGVPIDRSLCENAVQLVEMEESRLNAELFKLSDGVSKTHGSLTKGNKGWDWMKSLGAPFTDLTEDTLNSAIKGGFGKLHPKVHRALEIRKLCRDSSVDKYQAALNHASPNDYCQGAHVFYKAGPGRFAGAGVNFLNLRRLIDDEVPWLYELAERVSALDDVRPMYDELVKTKLGVIPTLGKMVRMMTYGHEGMKLVVCDYTAIEMRVLHWLAGDAPALEAIRAFDQGIGEEPYKISASRIFGVPISEITKQQRNIGKVQILGCGYMTGAEKFKAFCEQYGIEMSDERAYEIVQDYRQNNPLVRQLWYALGRAAVRTVKTRKPTQVGVVEFWMQGPTLNVRLPSGRDLKYYAAGVVEGLYGEEIEALDQRSGLRKAVGLPILIENIDQAVSRDLLADALIKCDAENLPVVLHVYDEIVIEIPETDDVSGKVLQQIMCDPPAWARGLPIAAKPGESRRYTK